MMNEKRNKKIVIKNVVIIFIFKFFSIFILYYIAKMGKLSFSVSFGLCI
jgi:hypothetical protein